MIKLPRTALSPTSLQNVHYNLDLLIKNLVTHMPSIHVRTGPIISNPAASIATTTLYTTATQPTESGHFRAILTLITTKVGSGGTATVTFSWNNGSGTQSATSSTINLTVLGSEQDLVVNFVSGAGQNITYSTTVAASAGSPAYSLNIKLEYLS